MADQDIITGVRQVAIHPPGRALDDEGLVVRWRRRGDRLEGLVTHEVDGKVVTEWIPALVLAPHSS